MKKLAPILAVLIPGGLILLVLWLILRSQKANASPSSFFGLGGSGGGGGTSVQIGAAQGAPGKSGSSGGSLLGSLLGGGGSKVSISGATALLTGIFDGIGSVKTAVINLVTTGNFQGVGNVTGQKVAGTGGLLNPATNLLPVNDGYDFSAPTDYNALFDKMQNDQIGQEDMSTGFSSFSDTSSYNNSFPTYDGALFDWNTAGGDTTNSGGYDSWDGGGYDSFA